MKRAAFFIGLCAAAAVALFLQTGGEDLAVLNRLMRYKMDGLIPLRFIKNAKTTG
jgi:hypothetical protein